jgi:hypothetical protein
MVSRTRTSTWGQARTSGFVLDILADVKPPLIDRQVAPYSGTEMIRYSRPERHNAHSLVVTGESDTVAVRTIPTSPIDVIVARAQIPQIPQIPLTSPSFPAMVLLRANYMATNDLPEPTLT